MSVPTPTITTSKLSNSKWLLQVTYEPNQTEEEEDYSQVMPIFVLDISGSMNTDNAIDHALDGMRKMGQAYLERGCPEVVTIFYNTKAIRRCFTSVSALAQFTVNANYRTNFAAAMREMKEVFNYAVIKGKQPRFYMMTDGCSNREDYALPEAMDTLRTAMNTSKMGPTMDVIGFTSSHDVNTLNAISQMVECGTYQYSKDASALGEIIGTLLEVSSNKCVMNLSWRGQKLRLTALRDDLTGVFKVSKQIMVEPGQQVKMDIAGTSHTLYVPVTTTELTPEMRLQYQSQAIREALTTLAQSIGELRTDSARSVFDQNLAAIKAEVAAFGSGCVGGNIFKCPTPIRKLIGRVHQEFTETITRLYEARRKHLSTDEHASLLSHATAYITKSRRSQKLQDRTTKNLHAIASAQELARRVGHYGLAFAGEDPDVGSTCVLSLNTARESAQEGSVLCYGAVATRTEIAVDNPGFVKFHGVGPSLVDLDSFKTAIEMQLLKPQQVPRDVGRYYYASDDNDDNDNDDFGGEVAAQDIHGAFSGLDGKTSRALQGLAREGINIIFPMYNPKTWPVTYLRLKEIFGFTATTIWTGFSFAQYEILPPMFLLSVCSDSN